MMIYSRGITSFLRCIGPLLLALLVTLACAAPASAQVQCTQRLAELPAAAELFGFRLGMTKEDVKTQLPRTVLGRTDEFGVTKTTINPDFDPLMDKTRFPGVRTISLDFLDDRLTSLWIGYDNTFKAQTIDDFVRMLSDSLHLPSGWSSWRSRGQQMHCADFQMTVTLVAGAPSFRILDQTAQETVATRREAKEQQNAEAEAASGEAAATGEEASDIIGDKHSRIYYPAACHPAKDITETNRIVFKSAEEAEKAGFKVAGSCH